MVGPKSRLRTGMALVRILLTLPITSLDPPSSCNESGAAPCYKLQSAALFSAGVNDQIGCVVLLVADIHKPLIAAPT